MTETDVLGRPLNKDYDQDEYGEVLNGKKTYKSIASTLEQNGSVVIGWTDQAMTHLDILFTVAPIQVGGLQRGMSHADLFVSVSAYGMFAFDIKEDYLHPGYVGEKLGLSGENTTTIRLAELITEVRKRLI